MVEVISRLYNEVPDGAVVEGKKLTKEQLNKWTLKSKETWNN